MSRKFTIAILCEKSLKEKVANLAKIEGKTSSTCLNDLLECIIDELISEANYEKQNTPT